MVVASPLRSLVAATGTSTAAAAMALGPSMMPLLLLVLVLVLVRRPTLALLVRFAVVFACGLEGVEMFATSTVTTAESRY